MSRLIAAAMFAAEKHRDQRRKDQLASPYINHPLAVAHVLCVEAVGIPVPETAVMAGLLHDTIEDTETRLDELVTQFGQDVADIVMEVTDDKTLPKAERKRLQIVHAQELSFEARLVKLADKICNLRDMAKSAPHDWSLERRIEYFDWCKAVLDEIRGTHAGLESLFDEACALRPAQEVTK